MKALIIVVAVVVTGCSNAEYKPSTMQEARCLVVTNAACSKLEKNHE